MVERPEALVQRMCDAGADMVVFHLEAADPFDVWTGSARRSARRGVWRCGCSCLAGGRLGFELPLPIGTRILLRGKVTWIVGDGLFSRPGPVGVP
jgi:hypothetical protein